MNRRKLLQGVIALPAMGLLSSCRGKEAPAKGTLKVYLHGPFGVVIQAKNQNRITAFVPTDPQKQHEFYFEIPDDPTGGESQGKRFSFELRDKGLEISGRQPYIDRGFNDFRLPHIGDWEPTPEKYFVSIDLPAPDVITFIGQAEGVQFKDGRTGMMPLYHVLEYRMRDIDSVRINSKELGEQRPLSCRELAQEYRNHGGSSLHKQTMPSERPWIEEELSQCSDDVGAFFLGVGLPEKSLDKERLSHAVTFFNEVLLPSFPKAAGRERLELQKILGYGQPCTGTNANADMRDLPPAAYTEVEMPPRLLRVAAVDDCKGGGLIGGP